MSKIITKALDENALAVQAINAANDGMTIVDMRLPDHPIIFTNHAFEQITGYKKSEVLGKNCRFLQGTLAPTDANKIIQKAIKHRTNCRVVIQNIKKDGTLFWNELSLAPIFDATHQLTHYVGIQKDVTIGIIQKEKIDYLSEHDDLTQLYNYRGFFKHIKHLIKTAKQMRLLVGIGIADIDDFKKINDLHGHIYGNHVLKIIGAELKQEFREEDIAARFGGDEFCFAMIIKEHNYQFFYEKIAKVEKAANFSLSSSFQISLSAGIAAGKADGTLKIDQLITQADAIMYQNKQLAHLKSYKIHDSHSD